MDWKEFTVLLHGIMPETPLGQIVRIRAEEDPDILKNFSAEEHSIRNSWRNKCSEVDNMSDEEKKDSILKLQEIFAKAFS